MYGTINSLLSNKAIDPIVKTVNGIYEIYFLPEEQKYYAEESIGWKSGDNIFTCSFRKVRQTGEDTDWEVFCIKTSIKNGIKPLKAMIYESTFIYASLKNNATTLFPLTPLVKRINDSECIMVVTHNKIRSFAYEELLATLEEIIEDSKYGYPLFHHAYKQACDKYYEHTI